MPIAGSPDVWPSRLRWLSEAAKPEFVSNMAEEVRARLQRLELPFNAAGLDPYGISRSRLQTLGEGLGKVYRSYFKTEVHGIEHVPTRGRAMLVANHSGGVAIDAGMLAASCFFEMEPPRLAHGMVERFVNRIPFVSTWAARVGQFTGLPEHARRLLLDERLVMVFPEGVRGVAKLYRERYSLVRFGTGFLRLALETGTPIIPVAVLGGGEAIPTVSNLRWLGKVIGVPYVPITPYLFAMPLPVRMMIRFGKPLHFAGSGKEGDVVISKMVGQVRGAISDLISEGRQDYKAL